MNEHFKTVMTKENLYKLYVEEKRDMQEISEILNVAVGSVYNYLKKYEIPTRSSGEARIGNKLSEEAKERLRKANTGVVFTKERRQKISEKLFKGGVGHKKKRSDGYIAIYFPDHPCSTDEGYIMEHVLVMECAIGRHLKDDEVVHHINHKKDDNRLCNLKLMTFKEHAGLHMRERWQKKKGEMTY